MSDWMDEWKINEWMDICEWIMYKEWCVCLLLAQLD